MKRWDIRPKKLTDIPEQYIYFRQENSRLLQQLRVFPQLPRTPAVRYHKTWDLGDQLLSRISYFVEPKLRICAYLSVPKNTPTHQTPGIVALHPEFWGRGTGKSVTVGFVEENGDDSLVPALPPERPKLSQHLKAFAYARELSERGFIVLSPDLPGFEEYRTEVSPQDDREAEQLSAQYILYGSSLAAKTLHDVYASVSALSAVNGVDDSSIGIIGYGLGGEFAVTAAAFDRRIKAAVAASGNFSYERDAEEDPPLPPHRLIPGCRSAGNDFDFFLDAVAPTPLMLFHTPSFGERRIAQKRRENTETVLLEKSGSFSPSVRRRAYSFLEKELWSYRRNIFLEEIE